MTTRNSLLGDLMKSAARRRWAARFETWAQPLSSTEEQKCLNAQNMISKALDGHSEMVGINYRVCPQGSYVANTNVRQNSDVDIRIHCTDTFHFSLPAGLEASDAGIYPATLDFSTYRAKVLKALVDKFGYLNVTDGSKAFNIDENTYRINADVVPAFDYKEYYYNGSVLTFRTGSCFFSKSGDFIINWPEQTIANGRAMNNRTNYRYKKVVRVLKGIRNEMADKGYYSAKQISSHLIACLVYNIADSYFGNDELYDDVLGVVKQIWFKTYESSRSSHWTEIDEIKPLFPASQFNRAKEVSDFFWELQDYCEMRD